MFGTTTNDGASFSNFPPANISTLSEGIQASLGITAEYAQLAISSDLFPFYDSGNLTLDAFNVSQRIATDKTFRCIDEATVYAGTMSHAFKTAYYYNFDRTTGGYDPNNLGASGLASGPVTPGYPAGNPTLPYFRLHGADVGFTYGNQDPLRNADDLKALQLISGSFAAFTRSGNPNPSMKYLQVRGYTNVSFRACLFFRFSPNRCADWCLRRLLKVSSNRVHGCQFVIAMVQRRTSTGRLRVLISLT
jgi:hypothetical protein